jgi:hypothetical protein
MRSPRALRTYCRHWLCRVLALSAAVTLLTAAASGAEDVAVTAAAPLPAAGGPFVPAEYGEIVYQKNGHYPRQIFIIGQSHRSALDGQADPDNVKVQAEIYRIGEWLIREKQVGLLLPEGFLQGTSPVQVPPADAPRESLRLDRQTLEAELRDNRRSVNAGLLLNASYHIPLGQVEDERLYRETRRLLGEACREESLAVRAELAGLQDERTAALLQNIPAAVEEAYRTRRIDNRQAMVTVGLLHVGEIINLLQRGVLRLPAGGSAEPGLKLLEQGYGVTVILPRTLAGNPQLLRLCQLASD